MNDIVTPRQPTRFFCGTWTGNGELVPHPLLRWVVRRERVCMTSEPVWLSETTWLVKDRFQLSCIGPINRNAERSDTALERTGA